MKKIGRNIAEIQHKRLDFSIILPDLYQLTDCNKVGTHVVIIPKYLNVIYRISD